MSEPRLWLLLLPVAAALRAPWQPRPAPTTRVAVLGGGFAGLTAARTLAKDRRIEVLLVDQRDYFEYTPGILRAWVDPTVHRKLVNPIARLLRSKRARFQRVPPGCAASLREQSTDGGARPLRLVVSPDGGSSMPTVDYECDYAVLATGGEQSPISDDRQLPDGTVLARRKRLGEQVEGVLGKAKSALVVGGGLTGIELAAELAESLGPGAVTLAVGPRLESRGLYPGDPGGGVLPGFRDTDPRLLSGLARRLRKGAVPYAENWLRKSGVDVCEEWAVPPPAGSTLDGSGGSAVAAPACARAWRRAGSGEGAIGWAELDTSNDLKADAVFDCRGLRPNIRQSFDEDASGRFGLPAACESRQGWLNVDGRFRLCTRDYAAADDADARVEGDSLVVEESSTVGAPAYGGRAYCCGDAAEKDKQERTAANAHAEGEYVALDIRRRVSGRSESVLPPFVAPPRLCAISLGKWDGLVVLGRWVAVRGVFAALGKAVIEWYFVNFLPLPYWVLRRLPFKQPRRDGGTRGLPKGRQLARSGGAGVLRTEGKARTAAAVVVEAVGPAAANMGVSAAVDVAAEAAAVAAEKAAEAAEMAAQGKEDEDMVAVMVDVVKGGEEAVAAATAAVAAAAAGVDVAPPARPTAAATPVAEVGSGATTAVLGDGSADVLLSNVNDFIEGSGFGNQLGRGDDTPDILNDEVCLVPGSPVVRVEAAPGNARRIFTGVDIVAEGDTLELVWRTLTDYPLLAEVVPNLISNKVVRSDDDGLGARLEQVGAADLAPGITFKAKTTLDVREYMTGLPAEMEADYLATTTPEASESRSAAARRLGSTLPVQWDVFPRPYVLSSLPHRDVTMQGVRGAKSDFSHYQGVWRMQALPGCAPPGSSAVRLTYSVELSPRLWVPVALLEGKIAEALGDNLVAIRNHVVGGGAAAGDVPAGG